MFRYPRIMAVGSVVKIGSSRKLSDIAINVQTVGQFILAVSFLVSCRSHHLPPSLFYPSFLLVKPL